MFVWHNIKKLTLKINLRAESSIDNGCAIKKYDHKTLRIHNGVFVCQVKLCFKDYNNDNWKENKHTTNSFRQFKKTDAA